MKKLAPLLLVVLSASLWSWTQRARPPLMRPTRANCAVHGIRLGDSEAEVIRGVGKPDRVERYYPKGRNEESMWTWGSDELPQLSVTLDNRGVNFVSGTSLTVGSKDYGIAAGGPVSSADILGTPLKAEPILWNNDTRTDLFTTWGFPEITVTVLSNNQKHVTFVQIENPKPRN